jgi:hypothetical protein
MAMDGLWSSISLHVENLVPGLATGGIVLAAYHDHLLVKDLTDAGTLAAVLFVCCCYMVGAATNIVARFVLDNLSHWFVRPLMLLLFARDKLENRQFTAWKAVNKEYSKAITDGLLCSEPRIANEVVHRRETGRILRSGWPPAILAVWLFDHSLDRLSFSVVLTVAWLVAYAFAEVTIFREAVRGRSVPPPRPGTVPTPARAVGST